MPMFFEVRCQIIRLAAETNKTPGKTGASQVEMPHYRPVYAEMVAGGEPYGTRPVAGP